MADFTDFQLFHAYNDLVKKGVTQPIRCPFCTYTVVIGHKDGDLRLECYTCNTSITPGLDLISNVRAVVKEHTP